MRIVSIVGARPQFVKLAVVARAISVLGESGGARHQILHTGQHYDFEMSEVFFRDLDIPRPDFHLEVGSASHGEQTGEMMKRIEPILVSEKPDWVVVYGDTNSTLAGAVVSAKLHIPTAHVESGLRSFNRVMPEEINRIVADHVSDVLFCPTATAVDHLRTEGLADRAVLVGDVMYDAALQFREIAERKVAEWGNHYPAGAFALATIHRAENVDDPERLMSIVAALEQISREICPVVLPLHPRTKKMLAGAGWAAQAVSVLPPVSYLEMLVLESYARFILTDSGGVQKEAYFFQRPCITLRDETEWIETLENQCNVLAGADRSRIVAAAAVASAAGPWVAKYGEGNAGSLIASALCQSRVATPGR
jgi:UDP-GlcNAc3NAcA epimerase